MEVPMISPLQKIILYESKMRFYIVGSNLTETRFRVLKIDRTEPRELHIQDDKIEYNREEVVDVLTTLDHGNRTKGKGSGIRQTLSAYGIFGFVRFLEGYYVVLITKRSCKQLVGPHAIYKIEDTSMVYIPNDTVRYFHPLESRYVKIFQTMDMSSDFYFSYSYDLTNTLQYNMIPTHISNTSNNNSQHQNGSQHQNRSHHETVIGVRGQPSWKFVWNRHLLKGYWDVAHTDWVLFIIHGFIGQCKLDVYGKPIYITLIGRRSNQYAGTRFLKRGSNSKGAVANEIETEQIVHDGSRTFLDKGCVSSFTQVRGSVPLSWSQDVVKMVPKPAILMDKRDPYAEVAGLHFNGLLKRYGAPIIVLNLVKRREKRAHESILKEELMETIKYLNQFLPPQHALQYIGFDMAHVSKRKNGEVLVRLAKIAKYCIKQTGFYLHLPPGSNGSIKHDERLKCLNDKWTKDGCRQNGTVRTNCVDCLDRTNTAQFAVGKCALAYQLYSLGVIEETELDFDTDCVRMLEMLYEDHGDTVALQYGGSQLVHRIKGYRKIAPWTEHSRDIMQTLSRYYSNAFSDLEKQQAINLFLGVFIPQEDKANLWELTTDYYLHNNNCTKLLGNSRKLYSQWWDECVIQHLPLSADEEMKKDCLSVCQTGYDNERVNEFDEYYKPWRLTWFEDLICFKSSNSMRNYMQKGTGTKEMSPFTVRVLPTQITDSVNLGADYSGSGKNPNISGKDSSMSVGSEGSTSSSDDSDVEGEMCLSDSTSECHSDGESSYMSLQDLFPSMKTVYKYDITEPSKRDQNLYQRYVDLGKVESFKIQKDQSLNQRCKDLGKPENSSEANVNKKSKQLKPSLELFAVSAFKLDSCYSVEPPPISKHARDIYQAYIDRGRHGAGKPRDKDYIMYQKYVGSKYG